MSFWISAASRSEMTGRSLSAAAATIAGGGALTPGGRRTVWPGSTLSLPSTRLPSTLTWPVRSSFCSAPWLSAG